MLRLITPAAAALAAIAACAAPAEAPTLATMIDAAKADAARRLPAAAGALELVQAQAVTWSDGALGCPEPGRAYTQALVPGWQIRLRAGTEVLDYHASRGGALLLCPPGRAVLPPAGARY
ncbi:MAG: hypothetical protein KIT28_14060 [Rubrivivax sp.]|nr:hypothetical protein [Rubrivivax sp.]HOW50142.1 hypothetical protein [Rubrivivax sp.]HRY90110.1 hypothetical protein [Rubrivivax sp.]